MVGLKKQTVTYARTPPKMINPRHIAGERRRRRRRRISNFYVNMAASTTDTSTLPVNHCNQSTAFDALNRKARRTRRKAGEHAVCLLFVGCLTSQQHASVSQGRIRADDFTCCHTEIEVTDQTFYLTQSQYTDTGPTNPSADPIMPGAWQGSHWSAHFQVTGMTRPGKISWFEIRTPDLPLPRQTP